MSDAPSWLTDENIDTAVKVAKNPVAQKAAKKIVENPVVQKAVIKEATKAVNSPPPPPPPASDAPQWATTTKVLEATDVEATGGNENNQVVSDFPIEEETLKEMQKWHIALRLSYIISAILMGVMAGLSLVSQKDLGLIFFAFYVIFFSLLLCCFEVALSFISRWIAVNFGFLYTLAGRLTFILFVGFMSYSLGLYGLIAMCVLYTATAFHLLVMYKFPRFEEYLRKKHYYEGRRSAQLEKK
mmetsp:Transcript_9862/g.14697  ORF Transcript_9862/g.14697 Transcript_9862/m.14697 type:complete len:242 (+) Transcript_9862:114-839(+)